MIYHGAWVDYQIVGGSYFGQAIAGSPLATFETNMGKKMAVVHWGKQWLSSGALQSYNTALKGGIDNAAADGRLAMIDWGNWQISGGHSLDQSVNYQSIIDGTNTFGGTSIDSYLHTFFNQAAVHGKPFFLRMWHEMNAANGWSDANFPWCIGNVTSGGNAWTNTPAQHIAAWQKIVGIARAEGANNCTFVWCPNVLATSGKTATYTLAQLYPGSDYVHWLGLDGYETGSTTRNTMQQIFRTGSSVQDSWALIRALDLNKPIAICETGSYLVKSGSDDRSGRAAWYKASLETLLPDPTIFPGLGMLLWFMVNYDHNHWTPDDDGTGAANVDAVQFKNSIGQTSWLAGNTFTMPPNRPIEPYSIQSEPDPWTAALASTRGFKARWKLNEAAASGTVADSGNVGTHTGTVGSGVTLGSTSTLPTKPTQTCGLFNGVAANSQIDFGSSTDYSPASLGTLSVVTMFADPNVAGGAGWIIALGTTSQFEWGLRINANGTVETVFFQNGGTSIANILHNSTAITNSILNFSAFSIDTATPTGYALTNGEEGVYANLSGGAYNHGTATLRIAGRQDLNSPLIANSRVGETLIISPMLSKFALRELYAAWKATIGNSHLVQLF